MKTKKIYNPPITEMVEVEFEGGFMGASMQGQKVEADDSSVNSYNQTITDTYDFTTGSGTAWETNDGTN